MSKETYLIAVGKLKDQNLEELEKKYLSRLRPRLTIFETKANGDDPESEGKEVLKKINEITKGIKANIILLSEKGRLLSSEEFSQTIFSFLEGPHQKTIFVLGGALGHGSQLLKINHLSLSLSKLTFPHKMARLLFIEQFYRAQTIRYGHPYHH